MTCSPITASSSPIRGKTRRRRSMMSDSFIGW
jgi:hypothetical protein